MNIERLQIRRLDDIKAYRDNMDTVLLAGELVLIDLKYNNGTLIVESDVETFKEESGNLPTLVKTYDTTKFLLCAAEEGTLESNLGYVDAIYLNASSIEAVLENFLTNNVLTSSAPSSPNINANGSVGRGTKAARSDHKHPLRDYYVWQALGFSASGSAGAGILKSERLRKITYDYGEPPTTGSVGDIYIKLESK